MCVCVCVCVCMCVCVCEGPGVCGGDTNCILMVASKSPLVVGYQRETQHRNVVSA